MNKAIEKLKRTRDLSTGMLKPLNISFESFLKFAQLKYNNEKQAQQIIDKLIEHFERN